MLLRILRILEVMLLIAGAVWAIGIVAVGEYGTISAGMRLAASFALVALGLVPYAITAAALRRFRHREVIEGKEGAAGVALSRALLLGAALILTLAPFAHMAVSDRASSQKGVFTSNTSNIQFDIPLGWAIESSPEGVVLPLGFDPAQAMLRKEHSACRIAIGQWDKSHFSHIQALSFATRVRSDHYQFDGHWWHVASSTKTPDSIFSKEERVHMPGEFRMSYSLRTPSFLLLTSDGTSVPKECDEDLNELLASVKPYFEPVHLTKEAMGTLLVERVWRNGDDSRTDYPYIHLVFIDGASKARYEALRLPPGASHADRYMVVDNKLYFAVHDNKTYTEDEGYKHDAALYVADPFTQEIKEVPGTRKADTYISSMYVHDDRVFYLASSTEYGICISGYRKCPADLYSVPLEGGESRLEAQVSTGQVILGYVEEEAAYYVSRGYGDAGCISAFFRKISSGKEEVIGDYGGCVDAGKETGDAYRVMEEEREAIERKAEGEDVRATAIRVEGGNLYPADKGTSSNAWATFLFIK